MGLYLRGVLKYYWYMLKFGHRLVLKGFPQFEGSARVNLKKGVLICGEALSMKTNSYIAIVDNGRVVIGNNVSIARNSMIICHDSITIDDNCAIAPNVAIYDHDHKFGANGILPGYKTSPVVIEKDCWIGVGCIILRGAKIGEGSVIGAGCVIKGNIPAHSLVKAGRGLHIEPIVCSGE